MYSIYVHYSFSLRTASNSAGITQNWNAASLEAGEESQVFHVRTPWWKKGGRANLKPGKWCTFVFLSEFIALACLDFDINIYIYTYAYLYIYIQIFIYTYANIYIYTHIYIHTSTVLKSHQAGKVTSSPWHGGDTEKSHQVVESHIREEESPWHSLFHPYLEM